MLWVVTFSVFLPSFTSSSVVCVNPNAAPKTSKAAHSQSVFISASRPPRKLASLRRYFYLLPFFDEQGNPNLEASLEPGRLSAAARRIALHPRFRERHREFHEHRQFQPDGIAIVFEQFHQCALDQNLQRIPHHFLGKGQRV